MNLTPPTRLRQLAVELVVPKPMRRGCVSERTIRCHKAGCACAENPKARHGPYFSFTRAVHGKTHSRFLTAEQAAVVRQQIETGQQFRGKLEAYWESCEDWADRELEGLATASAPEAEKGGSKRTSKTKSPRKLRGS